MHNNTKNTSRIKNCNQLIFRNGDQECDHYLESVCSTIMPGNLLYTSHQVNSYGVISFYENIIMYHSCAENRLPWTMVHNRVNHYTQKKSESSVAESCVRRYSMIMNKNQGKCA